MAHGTPRSALDDVIVIPFNDPVCARAILDEHRGELACVLLDLMPHRVGLRPVEAEFVTALRDWTREDGSLLVLDEVITLRSSYGGAQDGYDITPDLTAMGKAIGGGFPVGALAGRADVMEVMNPRAERLLFPHSGTFSANPITMTAGLTAMQLFDREAIARLNALTRRAMTGIEEAIARVGALADRIVTTSPDVTVSTNLGGWVNRRGIFDRRKREDLFQEQKVVSAQRWGMSPEGQHIELGIAENNLFILLGALGLSHSLFGSRLLPIGTLYDPFIQRGLDALNYACYQDARFIVVATPSGITLAPEGGAHQSISTPLIGMAQDGLAAFEPAFNDELSEILAWGFDYMQRDDKGAAAGDWLRDRQGGSLYLRLSTLALEQPARTLDDSTRQGIIDGGYWLKAPAPGAELAIVYCGAVAGEALAAHQEILEDIPGAGLLAVTSADRLNAGWHAAEQARQGGHGDAVAPVESLLAALAPNAALVTVLDGHPTGLSWLGGVAGHKVQALGVEHFGQSGEVQDLYHHYRIDAAAILDACAAACLVRIAGR